MDNTNHESTQEPRECGVIMPISSTINFDANHWSDVQTLHHRGIRQAGLEPKNVWAGSAVDRITPRILSNLFQVPIALCDITDLNSNVMLELGMRLTSKKPTIVVCTEGSKIPFDIGDFEVIFYPKNLAILGMERYFSDLTKSLTNKMSSYDNGTYQPFLSDVSVDVLEPQAKQLPFDDLVLKRLDQISGQIDSVKSTSIDRPRASLERFGTTFLVITPRSRTALKKVSEVISDQIGYEGDVIGANYEIPFSLGVNLEDDIADVTDLLKREGISAKVFSRTVT